MRTFILAASLFLTACAGGIVGDGDGIVTEDERPQVGWRAVIDGDHHDVAGVATLIDEDTIEITDFTFDGGGVNARIFLVVDGAEFTDELELTDNLVGTTYSGETLTLDLPAAASEIDWDTITVWCIPFGVSFGHASFSPE